MVQQATETSTSSLASWIETAITGCLFLIALFAPHSIAVTQAAWLLGMLLWLVRLAIYPRPHIFRTPLDYVLLGFFVLSGVSALFSYEPLVSIGKMRAASLFTIVYLVAENVKTLRFTRLLALTLVASCMVNVFLTAGQLAIGKGVKVEGVRADSPLTKATFHTRTLLKPTPILDGDTVWEVDGTKVNSPEELAALLARVGSTPAKVRIYRVEWMPTLEIPRGDLLVGNNAMDQLGIASWSRGRDWRATGFYGHWVTYAEVIQLIASLAFGLFLVTPRKLTIAGVLLFITISGLVFALGMTVTRASWAGFVVSATVMLAMSVSRRTLLLVGACAIPLVLGGLFVLRSRRSVGFIDAQDQSTTWRETVWSEGTHLFLSSPRHWIVGVGMDSIKAHWREWGLFDNGRIPMGHMHSNILQLVLERGAPALLMWLLMVLFYWRMLWQVFRQIVFDSTYHNAWLDQGIVLGALGGLTGFFVSGLVHYNWGDSEVVMVFYFIMALALIIERQTRLAAKVLE